MMPAAQARALRERVVKTSSVLLRERQSWEAHWREIADYVLPRRTRFNTTDRSKSGSKRNDKIINNTATDGLDTISSGMHAGLTSPARPWMRLGVSDLALQELPDVRAWLYATEKRMLDVFARSNFYNSLPALYQELAGFGTGCVIEDEDDEDVVRFTTLTAGTYALGTSHRGVVDTLVRELSMTARQMAERFGAENLSRKLQQALADPTQAEEYRPVWHLIAPNPDHVPGLTDATRKPFVSVYCEKGGDDDRLLRVSGYDSFPVMAPRWSVNADDVYGDSPAMKALGDVRALQQLERRKLELLDKGTKPPMAASAELKGKYTSLVPGDVTYVSGQQSAGFIGFQPVYVPDPRYFQFTGMEIREHERRIRTAFFADLFLMLSQSDRRQMTAREVEERHEEKLLMLGPVLERLHDELLNPIINRTFEIMWRRGLIDEPPDALKGVDVRPEYISILAQAQRAVSVGGIERTLTFALAAAQANPEALDKVDFDQAIDEFSAAIGSPPTIVRSDDAVAALRAARAEQQQAMQMAQMAAAAKDAAGAAKDASAAVPQQGSVLEQILSPSGGQAVAA